MSTARRYSSGNGKGASEQSNFAMTCNRLSSFLKENGSFRDIGIHTNFDVIGKPEKSATVDFLSNLESPVDTSTKVDKLTSHLPQYVTLDSFCKRDNSTNKFESKTAQMSIIYGGKVYVFDHISSDKARDMILLASGGNSTSMSNSPCETFGTREQILSGLEVNESDLPIARRASLHKFLAKRKDRATVRAPYQLHNPEREGASLKHEFDLNLQYFS